MYYVKKTIEISASHQLKLSYESKCENLHGHNWIIEIFMKSKTLNEDGMVILKFNTTAENIAKWITEQLGPKCYKVSVQESQNNIAVYEVD